VEVVHPRCAGIDVSKKDAKVCVRVQGSGRRATTATVTTWGAMSNEILVLREHLIGEEVTCVVMESTGDYWKPFYYLLEDALTVMLVNPRDARNRPGRKTDVSDAAWLADLGAHGLLRASLVPPPPIRRLRDLTRARTDLKRDRARQIHRLEKILEDAGIKLSSVATDIMGQSGRAMLDALVEGKADPAAMADLAKLRMRSKIPTLTEALTGRFTPHHGYLIRMHLDLIDSYTGMLSDLDAKITDALSPSLTAARELLCSIPGWSTKVAEVFLAETGGGNRNLKGALGIAALSVTRSKDTYFAAKYRRICVRRGPMKALVAVERAMVVAAHGMLTNGDFYRDPGANYFTAHRPGPIKANAIRQLQALGYTVTLEPATA
jgi:transposase